ncbi:MAG TPA: DEAD/DEAH box helicase family protein [Myxococcales bacterium]|nr:DEAD/DEAH box helicase family protein [Myxococcales bacterium]
MAQRQKLELTWIGKEPRIKRLSEYLGQSYFDYLAGLPDLVLIMDESHHYRAKAGMKAINELRPVLGLELTATPFVEKGTRPASVSLRAHGSMRRSRTYRTGDGGLGEDLLHVLVEFLDPGGKRASA